MRRQIAVMGLAAACAWTAGQAPGAAQDGKLTDDSAIARVGTQPITRRDLTRHLLTYYGQATLQQLIDRSLVNQEAKRLKVQVTDADLNARINQLKSTGGSNLVSDLEKQGIDEQAWKEVVRVGLTAEKVAATKWPVKENDLTRLSVRYARTLTEAQSKDLIRQSKLGSNFALLARQNSLDKENECLVAPDPFLRVENPGFFRLVSEANIRVGQVTPQPIPHNGYWLVLRLENVLPPNTLQGKERDAAIKKITGYRLAALTPTLRKRYAVVTQTAVPTLLADPAKPLDTVLVKAGEESITYKHLYRTLVEYSAKPALDQLTHRSAVSQEAARLKVTATVADLDRRAADVKKPIGETGLKIALEREGISQEAWRERLKYPLLAEKSLNALYPVKPEELERMTVRYVRVGSQQEAAQLLQLASQVPFEQLVMQRSLDKAGGGFIRPKMFLRVEQPVFFKAVADAGLKNGQILPQPVEANNSWYLLRLEGRFGPDTLTAQERDSILRRINLTRMDGFLEGLQKSYPVETVVPLKTLVADARQ